MYGDFFFIQIIIDYCKEGVDRGGGGTGIEGAESGVEGAGSGSCLFFAKLKFGASPLSESVRIFMQILS